MSFLKEVRISRGMNQSEVARQVHISQPAYCNIENAERKPSVEVAKRIAATLGFDWTRFYDEDYGRSPPEDVRDSA